MSISMRDRLKLFWPEFIRKNSRKNLVPYYTVKDYWELWITSIFILAITSLLPLLFITLIHYQLINRSVDSDLISRTDRLASNARRAVTFFFEERVNALRFVGKEIGYDRLIRSQELAAVLQNLKLGYGGVTDLSVIDDTGMQVAYAGPFDLEGKNYCQQSWFTESLARDLYISDVFYGFRGIPHVVIAAKLLRPDDSFYILRTTLNVESINKVISSYSAGQHIDIFLTNREGIIQTPTLSHGKILTKMPLSVPEYSSHTKVNIRILPDEGTVLVGHAFITTSHIDTPFILMVIKQKAGMMKVWGTMRSQIDWIVGVSVAIVFIVITIASTFIINKLYRADKLKAETMLGMEQSNQLATFGRMAAGVAHEINNPLALINATAGYIDDLIVFDEKYKDDDELKEYVDSILDAVDRCGTITGQLLGFVRRFDVRVQDINLKEMVCDVLNFHTKEAEYRNIKVNVDIPEDLPILRTDRGKLQQILINLINNAFQALSDGCKLDIRAALKQEDLVSISIADNGCGISEENLKHIFEPFFTTKQGSQGTGLGLAIIHGIVTKLHGTISVESKENKGTCFTVTLPLVAEEGELS